MAIFELAGAKRVKNGDFGQKSAKTAQKWPDFAGFLRSG
jgi:hypothetical protein